MPVIDDTRRRLTELSTLYRGLGPTARRAVWALLAVELVLIGAVQRDITLTPPQRIWGPKLLWRVIATQNLVGPLAYLVIGRRRQR